jgi:hypothetical protein
MHGAFASVFTEAWGSLGERRFLFLTLLGFVGAFGFIRLSTRLIRLSTRLIRSPRVPWWPGSTCRRAACTCTTCSSGSC